MKSRLFLNFLTILVLFAITASAVEVTLLVDKRGFPKKKDCFIQVALCDFKGEPNPSNEAFYAGVNLNFIITKSGDWELDDKFITEILPNINFVQESKAYNILSRKPIYERKNISKILIAIPKGMDTTAPFSIAINRADLKESAEFKLPEELWPDYPKFKAEITAARADYDSSKHLLAFGKISALLKLSSIPKYSFFQELMWMRAEIYSGYSKGIMDEFSRIRLDSTITKEKRLEDLRVLFRRYSVLLDSMSFDINDTVTCAALIPLRSSAIENRNTMQKFIDDASRDLDYSKVLWMSKATAEDFRFRLMIEALYTVFRVQDIDAPLNMEVTIPDSVYLRIVSFNLADTLNALKRIIARNLAQNQPLFPPGVVENMRFYSGFLKQPYVEAINMMVNYYQGKLEQARIALEKAEKVSSDMDMNEWLNGLRSYVVQSGPSLSKEIREISIEGMRLLRKGDFDGALQKFQRGGIIDPNSALMSYDLGIYNLARLDTSKAKTFFERAQKLDSTLIPVYSKLYNIYLDQSDWQKAQSTLETAVRINNTWEFNYHLAYSLIMVGDYHRAISVLDTAIALNQYNYDQYILQGDGYLKMGDKDIARQKYDHARMLDPNRDEAYRRLEGL